MIKLAILVIFLIIGIISAIIRSTAGAVNNYSQKSTIDKIKRNPAWASEYVTSLDIPYDKKSNISQQDFNVVLEKVRSSLTIGNYVVVYTHPISDREFVVFTEITYTDFDSNAMNETGDVNKKAYHNFLFRHNGSQNEMEILSELFSDNTSKFQKQEFIQALFSSKK